MLDHAILLQDLVEHLQWTSAIDHEIFRDDFKPFHDRLFFEDVLVVRDAEANTDAVVRLAVKLIRGHKPCDLDKELKQRDQRVSLPLGPL
jgi:hypothetical protein